MINWIRLTKSILSTSRERRKTLRKVALLTDALRSFGIIVKTRESLGAIEMAAHAVDVLIPCASKDVSVIRDCIYSIYKHSLNRIGRVYVVGRKEELERECAGLDVIILDENEDVEPRRDDVIYYAVGKDRSGWMWQQLLKLHADKISNAGYIYIHDADTVVLKWHVLAVEGRELFYFADEYHKPYYNACNQLIGKGSHLPFSCVSHGMTFNREVLRQLREKIQDTTQKKWKEAIVEQAAVDTISGFSEYEIYANYVCRFHDGEKVFMHNRNLSVNRKMYEFISKNRIASLLVRWQFTTLSGHSR